MKRIVYTGPNTETLNEGATYNYGFKDFWMGVPKTFIYNKFDELEIILDDQFRFIDNGTCEHRRSDTGIPGGNIWCLDCDEDLNHIYYEEQNNV
jgi:hypothetical protein